jgi:thiamine pyrophosphokinase
MSSHHFVKEDQEPALLIADAKAASYNQVQELLEWSPTILVLEQTLLRVLTWGIKMDVVIVESAHLQAIQPLLFDQNPVKILTCESGEDPMELGMRYLSQHPYKSVNILGGSFADFQKFTTAMDVVFFQNCLRWAFIRNAKYEKWLPAGRILQVAFDLLQDAEIIKINEDGLFTLSRNRGFWINEK